MRTLDLAQGSPAWDQHRLAHFNGSDAPAMMGASPYKTRTQLLRELAGIEATQVSPTLQAIYDRGHLAEAAARPRVEALIGEELYPVVGVSDEHPRLSASFDGVTMDERTGYECKLWSEALAAQIRVGELDPMYVWQLEHQAAVGNLNRIIFVAANDDASVFDHMEYRPKPGLRAKLLAGWAQLERDLAEFQPSEVVPEAVGRAPNTLPALHIEVTGMVKASNLAEFKEHAIAVFRAINTNMQTDQDFADADKTVKWCGEIEDRLRAAKDHALSQTQSIDQLFRAIDDIGAEARAKRLELEKLVKGRKDAVRFEIITRAKDALADHYRTINATLQGVTLSVPASFGSDLAGAIKGKKTVASVQDAADTALAAAKIEASGLADRVRLNLQTLSEVGHPALFADRQQLVTTKAPDDLRNLAAARIAQFEVAEQARMEKERARIREEEAAKLRTAAPEAPAAAIKATPTPASAPRAVPKGKPVRPSDDDIIAVLAMHYRVHESKVLEWLCSMDLHSASQRLASNF